ncbi:MAG: hypothetical protein AAB584_00125 [Patescibacteria group bacterium]
MAKINDLIFKAYDIRGKYPEEISEDIVFKIVAALVKFLNPDKLIVAHDGRKSSESLKESAMTAITAFGTDVIDIGLASSPLFYFAVNRLGAGGGVMITASHNPPDYNGLKIVREKAIAIGESNGLTQIRNLTKDIKIERVRKGKLSSKDLSVEYESYLLEKAGLIKEPEIEGVRFKFDPDSDRLSVFEKNKQIRADLLSGIVIKDFLEKQYFFNRIFSRPKFIFDLRFTKAISEYITENGGEAIRFRVGHPFIKEAMRENKALFGAELSGHFYFKDVFYVEAPILMKLKLLKIMNETGKSLVELIKPFQKYFHSGEINIEASDQKQAASLIQRLKENYKDGKIDELDGITVEYDDCWFNIRPSNTEPVLRLVVEAETQYIMEQKVEEITEAIRRFSV